MWDAGSIPNGFVTAHRTEDARNIRAPICCPHPGRPARSGRRSGGLFALTKPLLAGRCVLSGSDAVGGRRAACTVLRADHDGRARPGRAHADGRRDRRVRTDDDGHSCGRWQRHRRRHDSQDRRTGRRRANTKGLERVGLDGIANGFPALANFLAKLADCLEALLANKGGTVSDRLDAPHSGIDHSIDGARDGAADAPRVAFFLGPARMMSLKSSMPSLPSVLVPGAPAIMAQMVLSSSPSSYTLRMYAFISAASIVPCSLG